MEQKTAPTIGGNHKALRDQVLTELRRRIVDGEYAQGERLTENRLADDLGVSRNPVREALRVVETGGFVQMLPRRGAVVATLDDTAVRDLSAVREQLETLAAGLAAERARRSRTWPGCAPCWTKHRPPRRRRIWTGWPS